MTTLRRIDVSGRAPVVPLPQPAPQVDWIALEKLVIDDTYQRPLEAANWRAIERIAANFDWSSFGPLVLAPLPGGVYAIVDGQHRAHAAALCGFDTVPAMVVPMAPQDQARTFGRINGAVVPVARGLLYRAALAAGEDWAVRSDAAVAAAGCRLMGSHWSARLKKPGMVFSITLIRKHIEAGNDWAVTAGLRAIRDYDATGRVGLYHDYILAPWLAAIATDREFEVYDLAGFLRQNDPYKVIEKADFQYGGARRIASTADRARKFVDLLRAYGPKAAVGHA